MGWTATVAETLLALGLLIGWHLRWVSLATALLLLSFAVAMLVALGPKAPPRLFRFHVGVRGFPTFRNPSHTQKHLNSQ